MKRTYRNATYTTATAQNSREGWSALELHRAVGGAGQVVARSVFWDAEGQFAFEMAVPELPLDIVEEFVAEARLAIQIK